MPFKTMPIILIWKWNHQLDWISKSLSMILQPCRSTTMPLRPPQFLFGLIYVWKQIRLKILKNNDIKKVNMNDFTF